MNHAAEHNIALWPLATEDPATIKFWLKDLYRDETIARVIGSQAFKRLEDISFLGALDYTHPSSEKIVKRHRSRAEHSLHVAAIANYVSNLRDYPSDLRRHLILAALLHDIGHAPLSHSAEPYIKKKIGYGHHEAGEQIIHGKTRLGKDLNRAIQQKVDIYFISSLINGNASQEDGGDLFSSPINIDTIDGIIRSHTYITGFRSTHCRLAIAKASFSKTPGDNLKLLDSFWKMKDRVYSNLINNELGLLSDKASEYFFQDQNNEFEEKDLYSTERSWQQKHKKLFQSFSLLLKKKTKPSWIPETNFSFTDRKYYLQTDKIDRNSYACIKKSKIRNFETQNSTISFLTQAEFSKF